MNKNWDAIIATLPYIYKDNININRIKESLDVNKEYDICVLDQLYMRGLLTKKEYIGYVNKLIERAKDSIRCFEFVIKKAKEAEGDYDPMTHYCCAMRYDYD